MEKPLDPPKETDPAERTLLDKTIRALVYPIAIIPGAWVARASIRDGIYKNYSKNGGFADMQAQYSTDFQAITGVDPSQFRRGKVATLSSEFKHVPKETKKQVAELDKKFFKDVKTRFAERWNMNGMMDYWENLHLNQKINTATLAITVTGVTIGTLLTMANSKLISKLHLRRPHQGIDEKDGPSPSR